MVALTATMTKLMDLLLQPEPTEPDKVAGTGTLESKQISTGRAMVLIALSDMAN